jgi:hypothetical protein
MCTAEKAIIVASSEGGLTLSLTDGIWTATRIPDLYCLSPVTVKTVEKFSGNMLTFFADESGEPALCLENDEGDNFYFPGISCISPFRVKTDKGNFLVSPPTTATPWILTKISELGFLVLAKTGTDSEGAGIRFTDGSLMLLDAKERDQFTVHVEKLI